MPQLQIHLLPDQTEPNDLAGTTVVVLDILRASTTILFALHAGAVQVIPCLDVEGARRVATGLDPSTRLLAGERAGVRIPGFDLGNSPAEFTPQRVAGKTLIFTTTNGTRAMQVARPARRILIGSLVNASAVARELVHESNIHLLCAGTDGKVTAEDVLCAGLIQEFWRARLGQGAPEVCADEALLAQGLARMVLPEASSQAPTAGEGAAPHDARGALQARILPVLLASRGGRNLVALGFQADVELCSQVDCLDLVAELEQHTGRIVIP